MQAAPGFGKLLLAENVEYIFHQFIGRKENHIIAVPGPDDLPDIARVADIFLLIAPRIARADIRRRDDQAVGRVERRVDVQIIVITAAEDVFIVADGQHRGREKDGRTPLVEPASHIL